MNLMDLVMGDYIDMDMFDYEYEFENDNHQLLKNVLQRIAFVLVILFFISVYLLVSTLEFHGIV